MDIDDFPLEAFYHRNGTAVEDPWDHRCKLGVPGGSADIHTFQLVWSLICAAQALFLISKWPKVGWEAIYMPCCEALSYGLLSSGHGYLKLHGEYHYLPWIRYAAWLVTTPVLLNQVQGIKDVKIGNLRLAPIQSLANLLMVVMGVSAHLEENHTWKWFFFFIGCIMGFIVYYVAWLIFTQTMEAYAATKTEIGDKVVFQLRFIMIFFYVGWSIFPIIWMLGSEGFCLVEEHLSAAIHIPGDILSKNLFGLFMWYTRWQIIGGGWDINSFKARQEKERVEAELTPAEKRKAMLKQAEACFAMADACLLQANDCLQKAMQHEDEAEHLAVQNGGVKTPNEKALSGHPMETEMLANMYKLSYPLPFNVEKATAVTSKEHGAGVETVIRTSMQKLRRKQREIEEMENGHGRKGSSRRRSNSDDELDNDVRLQIESLKALTRPGDRDYYPPKPNSGADDRDYARDDEERGRRYSGEYDRDERRSRDGRDERERSASRREARDEDRRP